MQEELSTGEKIQNAKFKMQNYNSKLKINKFKCSSLRVPPFCGHRPETSGRCLKY
jgi:hypothetical protein